MKTSLFADRAVYDVISVKLAELPQFPENVSKFPLLAEPYNHNYTREHLLKAVNQLSVHKFADQKPGQLNLKLSGSLNVVSILNADNLVDALVLLVTNMRSIIDVAKVIIAQKNLAELAQWCDNSQTLPNCKERDFREGIVECVAITAVHYWSQIRMSNGMQSQGNILSSLAWVVTLANIPSFSELPRSLKDRVLTDVYLGIQAVKQIRPKVAELFYSETGETEVTNCSSQFLGALISLFKCETLQGAALKKGIQDAVITWINFDEAFAAPVRNQPPAVSSTASTVSLEALSALPPSPAVAQMSPRTVSYLTNNADKVRAELAQIAESQSSPEMTEILKAMSALFLKDL